MMKYIIIIFISFSISCTDVNKQYMLNVVNSQFKGIIENIYQDERNHHSYYFDIKMSDNSIKKIRAQSFPYSWKYANPGDSIIKRYGEASIIIKKEENSIKTFKLSMH